ncbi:MAG: MATE family efflux transporter [Bacteroidetes bacterium]|nr:MATE family efflux transporter [Bacteroidota bacterium]
MQQVVTYRNIWKISYPIILGGIAQTVVNVTDTAFLGRVSEVALGASAIAGLFYVTVFMLGLGFSIGTQIIVARYDGEKNFKEIGKVLDHSIYFMLPLAVFLFVSLKMLSPWLLSYFVKSPEVLASSIIYIDNRCWGILFAFVGLCIRSFYIGISNTRIVIYSTLISAISNFILNYILVFGKFGFAPMGIAGSALASSISEVISLLFVIGYTYVTMNLEKYNLFGFAKFDGARIKSIFTVAAPSMFQTFFAVWSWFVFFLIVEKMGERPLAISNLIRNMYMILMIPLVGFSSATNTLVSNLIGQGRQSEVFLMIKKIAFLSFAFTLALTLLNLLNPRIALSVFTNDSNLIEATLGSLYVICGSLLLFSVTAVLLSSVSGSGNTMASLIIETLTIAFYLLATWFAVQLMHWPIELVWCVEYVYFAFMGMLSVWYLKKKLQQKLYA